MMRRRFYDLSDFPALRRLSEDWQLIAAEYEELDAPIYDIARVGTSREQIYQEAQRRGLGAGWLQGWTHHGTANADWLSFVLLFLDEIPLDVHEHMPRTTELLNEVGHTKVCALSKLLPHTMISSHRHPELRREGLLQYHLCLTTGGPPCFTYLNVNGEFVQHVPGYAYVFDGSLPHFAVNATPEERVILYIEFYADGLRSRSSTG